jgi:hypothetical protein
MPEPGPELRWLADQGAQAAQPMSPAEIMRRGDRQRRRRTLRNGFAAVAVAAAAATGIVSGSTGTVPGTTGSVTGTQPGRHAPLSRPGARHPAPPPSSSPKPQPSPSPSFGPTPAPESAPRVR